jgi:aspartate-semialdehyde dehydrogenase
LQKILNMKVAVVGATGMVGRVMLQILEERKMNIDTLLPVASAKSVGKEITFNGKQIKIVSMEDAVAAQPEIALFSAGGDISTEWAPKFAAAGTTVIDNSSAWRMHPDHKLIVPEINAQLLSKEDKIIANPNCSTIQMVMALAPLKVKYGIKRIVVSTYQSISGTGKDAVEQMENERNGVKGKMVYPYSIDKNCLPHCDVFMDNDYTKEEMKLVEEPRKIFGDAELAITATAVRIPLEGGHSESINVEFFQDFDINDVRKIIHETDGLILQDNPDTNTYPMPKYAHHRDEVFVGRLRRDESQENTLNMWVVADNLRKGAATNTIQIAEYLIENTLV